MAILIGLGTATAWAAERSSTLLLTIAAPAEESARLEAVARELLEPQGVHVEPRQVTRLELAELRRASTEAYFARVWVTLDAAGSARLYLEHGASDRLLVRDVPGDPNNPELVREEVGHILQAAVEGLKAGEEIGEPRRDALAQVPTDEPALALRAEQPVAAPSAPPVAARPRSALRFGPRYEARWQGDGARFEDGPGVFLALTSTLGGEVAGYYRRPLRIEAAPVGVQLETVSLRAQLTLALMRSLRLGAGLGADLVRVSPLATESSSLALSEPSWLSLAMARLQATYGYEAWRFLELQVALGADLDLSGTRYVLQRGTEVNVSDPLPLRPFLSLGAGFP